MAAASEEDLVIQVPKQLMPSARIRGRLVDENGQARQGIGMNLNRNGYWVASSGVDPAKGSFTFGPLAPGTYEISSWISNSKVPPFHLEELTVAAGQDLNLGEIGTGPQTGKKSDWLDLSVMRADAVPIEQFHVFLDNAAGLGLGWLLVDGAGHARQSLVAGDYELSAHPANAQWLRRKFTIIEDQESKIELLLRPAARRYLTFPYPVPEDWQGVKRVDYVIKSAAGDVILDGSMDSNEISFTVVPGFEIGQHTVELRTDDGRRYVGSFAVESLDKSSVPIVIEVEERSGR